MVLLFSPLGSRELVFLVVALSFFSLFIEIAFFLALRICVSLLPSLFSPSGDDRFFPRWPGLRFFGGRPHSLPTPFAQVFLGFSL